MAGTPRPAGVVRPAGEGVARARRRDRDSGEGGHTNLTAPRKKPAQPGKTQRSAEIPHELRSIRHLRRLLHRIPSPVSLYHLYH
jgi:hypothetical protein